MVHKHLDDQQVTNDFFLGNHFQLLEEEEIDVPVVKESVKEETKMETDDTPNDTAPAETDVNMQDAKPGVQNGVPESGEKPAAMADEKPVQMDTDAKV